MKIKHQRSHGGGRTSEPYSILHGTISQTSTDGKSPKIIKNVPYPLIDLLLTYQERSLSPYVYNGASKRETNLRNDRPGRYHYKPPTLSIDNSTSPTKGPFGENRRVTKTPYKVLNAPELQEDFYLNLVDWSFQNQLAVGMSSCVYLWSPVKTVQWADKGDLLAVGTARGDTQIWDATTLKKIRNLQGHTSRIGCLAWNGDTICSGSRDRTILHRDIRCDDREVPRKLTNHRQEVCGLKWSPDKQLLASGGNDNQLLVWNLRRPEPVQTYTQHNAAVKALAWSPHHHGVLVSGGGTADRCLRFWNTLTGQPMQCIDTGSQVCNVAWSKNSNELVSTHGYGKGIYDDDSGSANHVIVWDYPSLKPVTKWVAHDGQIHHLAVSPDGESIVTGAGDEKFRFWNVFNKVIAPKEFRSKL